MKNYDAIIIGFGKGGKTLAADLGSSGLKVALIEKSDKMFGGTCINVGCIPSKELILRGQESKELGLSGEAQKKWYRDSVAEKQKLTQKLRQKNYDRLINAHVDLYVGSARFVNDETIEVSSASETIRLTADKFFINTGAVSFVPPIKGIDGPRIYTSETLMDVPDLPEKLVIVGGGYIGLEFASMYASFGAKVTVLQDQKIFLPNDDRDVALNILHTLNTLGIEIVFGVDVREFIDEGHQTRIRYVLDGQSEDSLMADAVLISTGRRPYVGGLDLDKAHVALTTRGAIQVDDACRTTNERIYAMGDVVGGLQFTYTSLDDYRIVKSQVYVDQSYNASMRSAVPYTVFLTPPYSRVGMGEEQAKTQGYDIKIAQIPAASIVKTQILKQPAGLLKVVIDAKTDLILGAMLYCADSYEMINLIKLAMDAKIKYQLLRDNLYTHPTMTEAFNELFSTVRP